MAARASACISTIPFWSMRRFDAERKALYAPARTTLSIAMEMSSSITVTPCSALHMLTSCGQRLGNDGSYLHRMRLPLRILPADDNADGLSSTGQTVRGIIRYGDCLSEIPVRYCDLGGGFCLNVCERCIS